MHTSALGYKMKNLCFGRFFCHFVSNIMSDEILEVMIGVLKVYLVILIILVVWARLG